MTPPEPDLAARRGVETVYQPAEDSRLLANAAVDAVEPGQRALDVGTGSGYVGEALADAGARVVGCDLTAQACRAASDRGLAVVRADLVAPFRAATFDLVAFNPPYLPTSPDAEWDDPMEQALSGGPDGRRVVDPFLDTVGRVLAPDGTVVLLVSTLTGLDAVRERARANGFTPTVVAEDHHPFETLTVLALSHV